MQQIRAAPTPPNRFKTDVDDDEVDWSEVNMVAFTRERLGAI